MLIGLFGAMHVIMGVIIHILQIGSRRIMNVQ